MGMPIVVPKPYTKSERVSLTDPRKGHRDSRMDDKRDESDRICFFLILSSLHSLGHLDLPGLDQRSQGGIVDAVKHHFLQGCDLSLRLTPQREGLSLRVTPQ